MAEVSLVKMASDDFKERCQRWFKKWLSAVKQQAITWTKVDQDPCRHMTSLGHNDVIKP